MLFSRRHDGSNAARNLNFRYENACIMLHIKREIEGLGVAIGAGARRNENTRSFAHWTSTQ